VPEVRTIVVVAVLFILITTLIFFLRLACELNLTLTLRSLTTHSTLLTTSISQDRLELLSQLSIALVFLDLAAAENVIAVHAQNILARSGAARLPVHGGPGCNVPQLERLVVAHVALVLVFKDVFLLVGDDVEGFGRLSTAFQGRQGVNSEGGRFVTGEMGQGVLGELLDHGSEDLALFDGALDSVAVLLDQDVGDVHAVSDLVVVGHLEVLGVLSIEGLVKLAAQKTDVHAVEDSVADGSKPGALIKDTRVIAGDLGLVVVDNVKIPDAADNAKSSLAILDDDTLGEAVELVLVVLLIVPDLITDGSDTALETAVVECVSVSEYIPETRASTHGVRDSEAEGAWGGLGLSSVADLVGSHSAPWWEDGNELGRKLGRRHDCLIRDEVLTISRVQVW
jgi:hypothetical protein